MSARKQPSRESFFALYWDHARDHMRGAICILAGVSTNCCLFRWDELEEMERDRLGAQILTMVEVHDENRLEDQRRAAARLPAKAAG